MTEDEKKAAGQSQYGLRGLTVGQVMDKLGLTSKLPNMGLWEPDKTATGDTVNQPQTPAQPKTIDEQMDDLMASYNTQQEPGKKAQQEAGNEVATIQGEVNQMRADLDKMNLDKTLTIAGVKQEFYKEKDLIEGQPIPMGEINKQLSKNNGNRQRSFG